MKVGILGLGLIGGSLARAYALEGHTVYAQETDEQILSFAILSGAVHAPLDEERIAQCELILLAIYPDGSASWLENHAPADFPQRFGSGLLRHQAGGLRPLFPSG